MYYTHCVDHTPLCNIKVCIVSSHTCCVDYTHCTRLYNDVLHYIHCVVLYVKYVKLLHSKVPIFYVQPRKITPKKFTRTLFLASLTNISYGPAFVELQGNHDLLTSKFRFHFRRILHNLLIPGWDR